MATLKDLITQFSEMDTQGQIEKVREIRKIKYTVKPATARRKRETAKKRRPAIKKLTEQLTLEQKRELLEALKNG
jgi:hypothetical protein